MAQLKARLDDQREVSTQPVVEEDEDFNLPDFDKAQRQRPKSVETLGSATCIKSADVVSAQLVGNEDLIGLAYAMSILGPPTEEKHRLLLRIVQEVRRCWTALQMNDDLRMSGCLKLLQTCLRLRMETTDFPDLKDLLRLLHKEVLRGAESATAAEFSGLLRWSMGEVDVRIGFFRRVQAMRRDKYPRLVLDAWRLQVRRSQEYAELRVEKEKAARKMRAILKQCRYEFDCRMRLWLDLKRSEVKLLRVSHYFVCTSAKKLIIDQWHLYVDKVKDLRNAGQIRGARLPTLTKMVCRGSAQKFFTIWRLAAKPSGSTAQEPAWRYLRERIEAVHKYSTSKKMTPELQSALRRAQDAYDIILQNGSLGPAT